MLRRVFPGSLIGSLLRSRPFCVFVAIAAMAQITLAALRLPGWPCLWLKLTGSPCAGCGISRSVAAAATGRLAESLHLHLFGPLAAALILLFIAGAMLRDEVRLRLAATIEALELRTGISGLLIIGLLGYWLFRLVVLGGSYVHLMHA
jgi:hypothetical protein